MIALAQNRLVWVSAALVVLILLLFLTSSRSIPHIARPKPHPKPKHHEDRDLLEDVRNSTLGFQKIFVINLKSRTDHRDSTSLAASLTGMKLTYIDAVTTVNRKTMPHSNGNEDIRDTLSDGQAGCWRSHLTAVRTMLEEDLESALIIEDDGDWDVRLKDQLVEFAKATQLLLQPKIGSDNTFLDPSYHSQNMDQKPLELKIGRDQVQKPTTSPYGDTHLWDLLWLGHCGARASPRNAESVIPMARVTYHDPAVALRKHLDHEYGADLDEYGYPEHTRMVFRSDGNVCTLGYALSKRGAQRMLYEIGLKEINSGIDLDMDSWCRAQNRTLPICVTVLPPFIGHFRPKGKMSDMSDLAALGDEVNEFAFAKNIRVGTKVNVGQLVEGSDDLVDSFPDY